MFKIKRLYAILMGLAVAAACVNEEYDLSKEVDTEMTILKDVTLPIGDVGKISIAEILDFDPDEEPMVHVDHNGDLSVAYTCEKVSAQIDVPTFKLAPSDGIRTNPIFVYFRTGPAAGMDASVIPGKIVYSDVSGTQFSSSTDIEVDSQIPSQILDVRSVTLDASFDLDFKVNYGAFYLIEGFELELPEILSVKKKEVNDNRFELVDGHKLVLKEDIKVSAASPLALSLAVEKITIPGGSVAERRLKLNEKIIVNGDFYISPSDFTYIPYELDIEIRAGLNGLDVKSAEIKADLSTVISGIRLLFDDISDVVNNENICLDIYNPTFSFEVDNSSPFSFGAATSIIATASDMKSVLVLGDDPKINLPANTLSKYVISRRPVDKQGVTNIVIPELSEFMKIFPRTVEMSYINMRTTDKDFITVNTGDQYSASILYAFNAPLAFGDGFSLDFSTDLEADVSMLDGAELRMNIVNSIPFDFDITAEVLDADKQPISGIELNVDCSVKGGTHLSPVETPVTLYLRNNGSVEKFGYIRLNMSVKSPAGELVGVALNKNQGLELKDVTLSLKEGFTINK